MNTYAGFDADIESITDLISILHEGEIISAGETEALTAMVEDAKSAQHESKATIRNRFVQYWAANDVDEDEENDAIEYSLEGFFEHAIDEDDPESRSIDIPLSLAAIALEELKAHSGDEDYPEDPDFECREDYVNSVRGELMMCILAAANIVVIEATETQAPVIAPEKPAALATA